MRFEETELGFELIENDFLIFFGKHLANINSIRKKYPFLDFASVKQVHGDATVSCSKSILDFTTADGLYSDLVNTGLLIKTADCFPILSYHQDKKLYMAIHAGWRGVANKITQKSFQSLAKNYPPKGWKVFIGPHIQKESFLVQNDCLQELAASTQSPKNTWSEKNIDGLNVDLNILVKEQLNNSGITADQITWLNYDTKQDLRFHSNRRDRELSGRQLSFIARL